jgi:hypothetical protein
MPIIDALFQQRDFDSLRYVLLDLERGIEDARTGRGWPEGKCEIAERTTKE